MTSLTVDILSVITMYSRSELWCIVLYMNKDVLHDQIRHTYRFVVSQGLLVQIKTTEYCGKRMF